MASRPAPILGKSKPIGQGPWAALFLLLLERAWSVCSRIRNGPCQSKKLLFGRRRKSRAAPREAPNATCSEVLLPRLPEPRWAWGLRKPSPPSEWDSRGLAPPGEVAAVSAAETSIPRHKNSPTARQGGAVSQHRPPPWSRKNHMLGDPEVFLELLGAKSVPQVDWFP